VTREHRSAEGVNLNLPRHVAETGSFKAEFKPADA